MDEYRKIANDSRKKVLELVYKAGTSHIGSLMGAADIFAVLFEKIDLNKDKFILSCGWKAAMLYYHLLRKGKITLKELNSYCQPGSKFIGLAEPIIPDIKFAGVSMGYGFPAAVGFALSKKLKGEGGKVYCYMSDGELNCGTTWQASLLAAHHRLDNLVVFVEANAFQAMGRTEDILFAGFPTKNWSAHAIDGHDYNMIERAIHAVQKGVGQPLVFITKTIKGKGVSFMEGENKWHYLHLEKEDYQKALKCLK